MKAVILITKAFEVPSFARRPKWVSRVRFPHDRVTVIVGPPASDALPGEMFRVKTSQADRADFIKRLVFLVDDIDAEKQGVFQF